MLDVAKDVKVDERSTLGTRLKGEKPVLLLLVDVDAVG